MTETTCAWCDAPATATVRIGRYRRYPACPLHKAGRERKNTWLPCVINADFDEMTLQEQARVLRETKWADNVTNSEWPALLRRPEASRPARSKLKRKAIGWLMALSRIVYLNGPLGDDVLRAADDLYRRQLREAPPIPWKALADVLDTGWRAEDIEVWLQALGNLERYRPGDLQSFVAWQAEIPDPEESLAPTDGDQEAGVQ